MRAPALIHFNIFVYETTRCMKTLLILLSLSIVTLSSCRGDAQELIIASNSRSDYSIVLPAEATALEQKAGKVLQNYIRQVSGATVPVIAEGPRLSTPAIYLGNTKKADKISSGKRKPESYMLHTDGKDLVIYAGSGHGIMYGTYYFIETYMHCRKPAPGPAILPESRQVKIPGRIDDERRPLFIYRECYYPAAHEAEYLEWNQLQQLDDLWGVWGHSYNKLVPAQTWFKSHPEYFALVKGRRQATQLCLSNEDVYKIMVAELKKRMANSPDAIYWSVSPNDDNGFCECDKCRALDNEQGSHAGSLIKFVNRVAAAFPDKKFTTLAYGYTHKAPKMKPAENVYVFLSDIDAFRDKPLAEEGSAGTFRSDLKAWHGLTENLFVWDYVTQFTNYLAPFPNFHTLQPNMQYLKDNGVKGMFVQGSGDTYGEWAELRSYVIAKLFQDDKANVKQLVSSFIKDYYGGAAKYIQQYYDLVEQKLMDSHRKLDIYGNPVNEWKTWLSPEAMEQYSNLFDKAEGAVEGTPQLQDRVMRARLPLEYTVLQQARFYGIEKHGFWMENENREGLYAVKAKFADKVSRFVANCKKAGVTELSEAGPARHPDEYLKEWNDIFKAGVTRSRALNKTVTLQFPFAEDYPAKGNRTLVDGNPGYLDFSYNWLCFYGVPMIATIDLGRVVEVDKVSMHFLDDPRHWIFLPEKITVEVSEDGNNYHPVGATLKGGAGEEHYEVAVKPFEVINAQKKSKARYIKVTASNLASLPEWRYRDGKKPMIACDEIYVQ